jgi:hypothetical protein
MIAFTWRFSSLLKGLDPHRLVSSGFSVPRAEAEHLRRNPTWRGTRESWKPDSDKEFGKNIRDIHAGVDIISIHLYDAPRNRRFGSSDALDLVDRAKAAADEAGKPLFIGEFGDPDPTQAEPNSFVDRMLGKVATQRVPYAAVWVWEFYQRGTYLTHDNRHTSFSLEPGRTDYLIGRIRKYNEGVKTSTPSSKGLDVKPPRLVLTWPLDCAVAKEDQIFYAVASDDSGDVERVEFALDGKLLASKDKSPYQLKVEVQDWTPGVHLVEARAFDRSANSASWRTHVVAEPYPSHGECALRQ